MLDVVVIYAVRPIIGGGNAHDRRYIHRTLQRFHERVRQCGLRLGCQIGSPERKGIVGCQKKIKLRAVAFGIDNAGHLCP